MYILFDDAGKPLTGRILSETDAALQVELDSGRRAKVKAAHVLLRFERPEPAELLQEARRVAQELDLEVAWEFAPEEEFGFAELAREYFSAQADVAQQVGVFLGLFEAPHYFRRAGKGRFKKAPKEQVLQALAAIEKKKAVQAQIDHWASELAAGRCPEAIAQQLVRILFKPDKNSPEYKAVVEAAKRTHTAALALLRNAGAIRNAYQFHWQRFLLEFFPKGTGFAPVQPPPVTEALPRAEVRAFSVDDSSTTEIDDALSVQGLGSGSVTVGIHIAAPGLGIVPDSAIDHIARARLSTVYMPGHKITMLPEEVVAAYTLQEGRDCPALSLYLTVDEVTLATTTTRTVAERVPIAANLRHDQLDETLGDAFFAGSDPTDPTHPGAQLALGWAAELRFLHRLALHWKAQREQVRGKPETFTRPDYSFKLLQPVDPDSGPRGDETVLITPRRRGAPLDLIVAEAMIVANRTWGQLMADSGVPGIYRSQASLAPGIKVRMGTKPLPHAGIGVPCYAWSTSPLRRYTDLVNQWQILACARHGAVAALQAPFKPKDTTLLAIVSAFDAAYTAYNQFQNGMERYWTLKHLAQAGITELTATVLKDGLVRAETLPLVFSALGAEGLPRHARVRVRLGVADDISLELSGSVLERLDAEAAPAADVEDDAEPEELAAAPLPVPLALDEELEAAPAESEAPTPAAPTAEPA